VIRSAGLRGQNMRHGQQCCGVQAAGISSAVAGTNFSARLSYKPACPLNVWLTMRWSLNPAGVCAGPAGLAPAFMCLRVLACLRSAVEFDHGPIAPVWCLCCVRRSGVRAARRGLLYNDVQSAIHLTGSSNRADPWRACLRAWGLRGRAGTLSRGS